MKIKTSVTSGGAVLPNHGLKVRSAVKAGGTILNHGLRIKSTIKAGMVGPNHGQKVRRAGSGRDARFTDG